MTGILDKLYVEHGVNGARVMGRTLRLTGDCLSDAEIQDSVQMLKDDLDACAKEMKRLLKINRSGALFEGWPAAKDYVLDTDPESQSTQSAVTSSAFHPFGA